MIIYKKYIIDSFNIGNEYYNWIKSEYQSGHHFELLASMKEYCNVFNNALRDTYRHPMFNSNEISKLNIDKTKKIEIHSAMRYHSYSHQYIFEFTLYKLSNKKLKYVDFKIFGAKYFMYFHKYNYIDFYQYLLYNLNKKIGHLNV